MFNTPAKRALLPVFLFPSYLLFARHHHAIVLFCSLFLDALITHIGSENNDGIRVSVLVVGLIELEIAAIGRDWSLLYSASIHVRYIFNYPLVIPQSNIMSREQFILRSVSDVLSRSEIVIDSRSRVFPWSSFALASVLESHCFVAPLHGQSIIVWS
ncbi:hypothetical protein AB6A40_004413 [Gnathostoma spinigerum]|uniref:Uncharacterized protein n=1 Tax=Gnathostoma spinigerum TaxID=75299 RepID=A0ABD6EK27_9BILA